MTKMNTNNTSPTIPTRVLVLLYSLATPRLLSSNIAHHATTCKQQIWSFSLKFKLKVAKRSFVKMISPLSDLDSAFEIIPRKVENIKKVERYSAAVDVLLQKVVSSISSIQQLMSSNAKNNTVAMQAAPLMRRAETRKLDSST